MAALKNYAVFFSSKHLSHLAAMIKSASERPFTLLCPESHFNLPPRNCDIGVVLLLFCEVANADPEV